MLSGSELAHALNFPRKSVSGLPVFECVPFGREVITYGQTAEDTDSITLGVAYHMRREESTKIKLSKNDLTAHTFVTGSTGSGKSNTIYTMLDKLCAPKQEGEKNQPVHFLVIEPAKGEYKDTFGGRDDVKVYGTNPYKTELLKLNPFSFPSDTHVLEHIDRLVEIFNACWPMYAAMPAVLKAAVEEAYTSCGWNLSMSKYLPNPQTDKPTYPTFQDVMNALPTIIDVKGFSKDTQGDYKGALLTRLESLTNGINGQVFCSTKGDTSAGISDESLFNQNVVVDLSRVGSSETKALLMGILILKLKEFRMAEGIESDSQLRHITVLEEAHNLLRRTSMDQSQEGANLQGKSVEMLTNAIAEMRTYGEGFIIADQSPGLLDMAAIRNTNTKIILRLPDENDRQLVGKAAGLNDDQIVELARLDKGVAAVYQNHWIEPVLCKVDKFERKTPYVYTAPEESSSMPHDTFFRWLLDCLEGKDAACPDEDVDSLRRWVANLDTGKDAKKVLWDAVSAMAEKKPIAAINLPRALYCAIQGKSLIEHSESLLPEETAIAYLNMRIQEALQISGDLADRVRQHIQEFVNIERKDPHKGVM